MSQHWDKKSVILVALLLCAYVVPVLIIQSLTDANHPGSRWFAILFVTYVIADLGIRLRRRRTVIGIFAWWRKFLCKPGHCEVCGYNLRGNVSGRCSECGALCKVGSGHEDTADSDRALEVVGDAIAFAVGGTIVAMWLWLS